MKDETTSLALIPENGLTQQEFKKNHVLLATFVKNQLREAKDIANGDSGDYGVIPYTKKLSLLKPGAEKLLILHGYTAHMELVKEVEDFERNFVMYKYRCIITHAASKTYIADAVRSCNNKEKKHSTKAIYDAANTIESIAQKRALVAATVQATMASEIFDADVSEDDTQAPHKTVTQQEDPRRVSLINRLYGTATEHGWTNAWIHKAVLKKWNIDSLTNCSNNQIEELTEFILEKYVPVEKGEKPRLKDEPVKEVAEAEIVESEDVAYSCKGEKHNPEKPETMVTTTFDNPWCSEECRLSYFGGIKSNSRMQHFIKTGTFPESGKKEGAASTPTQEGLQL